jgi:hypothetical protein
VLEFTEEAFDQVSLFVDAAVDGALDEPVARCGNMSFGAGLSNEIEERIGIVAAICDDMTALQPCNELWRRIEIMRLACRQYDPDR